MKLVVGLGNPGEQYRLTLHNVGFRTIDLLVAEKGWGRPSMKSAAEYWKQPMGVAPAVFMKPLTYMNLSGQAVGEFIRYFKISTEDTLIVSDDIELPPGTLRYREKGGHGGHNGLRSIIQHVGENFKRLRIGVGRPDGKAGVAGHVLSGAGANAEAVEKAIADAAEYTLEFIETGSISVRPAPKT